MNIDDAQVVLRLAVDIAPKNRKAFLAFCRKAFPVYESVGGCRMELYEELSGRGRHDEVGYYETLADYRRAEAAIKQDPIQTALIKEWRSLLKAPPKVSVYIRASVVPKTSSIRRRTRQFSKSME